MKDFTLSSRPMRILGIVALLAGAVLVLPGQAQTNPNAAETRKLSLEDCIEITLHHNLDIQINRYNPELDRYALLGIYGAYEPTISISGEHDFNRSAGGVDPQGRTFSGTETESDAFSAGLS